MFLSVPLVENAASGRWRVLRIRPQMPLPAWIGDPAHVRLPTRSCIVGNSLSASRVCT